MWFEINIDIFLKVELVNEGVCDVSGLDADVAIGSWLSFKFSSSSPSVSLTATVSIN